jgi:hypothetical protein
MMVWGCGDYGEPEAPAPQGSREEADVIAGTSDPLMALFDLQTVLEATRAATDSYPTTGEFTYGETWRVQRAVLDRAFEEWSYSSHGFDYRLTGTAGGQRFEVASPDPSEP